MDQTPGGVQIPCNVFISDSFSVDRSVNGLMLITDDLKMIKGIKGIPSVPYWVWWWWLSPSVAVPLFVTVGHLCPRDSPDKNIGVSRHFLLQGIIPTQGSNPGFYVLQTISCIGGGLFTDWATRDHHHQLLSQFSSVAQSRRALWPRERQHSRLPCPSPTPGACSNSCPSSGDAIALRSFH